MPALKCARCGKSIEVQNFQLVAICPHCGWPPDEECYGFGAQMAKPHKHERDPVVSGLVRGLIFIAKLSSGFTLLAFNYAMAFWVTEPADPTQRLLVRVILGAATLVLLGALSLANTIGFARYGETGFGCEGPRRGRYQFLLWSGVILEAVALVILFWGI